MSGCQKNKGLAACWSGGKDCCYACHLEALAGRTVTRLFHIDKGPRVQHGTHPGLIRMQASALGLEVVSVPLDEGCSIYELYLQTMRDLKSEGFAGLVFGDLGGAASRLEWFEGCAESTGLPVHLPLYGAGHRDLLERIVSDGFEAILVNLNASLFGREWAGRPVNREFLDYLDGMAARHPGLSCAGELGEYHTFVVDGPGFRRRLHITSAETVLVGNHWFFEIENCELGCDRGGSLHERCPARKGPF